MLSFLAADAIGTSDAPVLAPLTDLLDTAAGAVESYDDRQAVRRFTARRRTSD